MSSCCGGPLRCPGLGSKVRLSTRPPALPVGKGAGRCAPWSPGVFSSRGILGVRRTGLRCIVLVWAPRCVCLPIPPPFPWGREPVAALRCGPRWVLLPGFLLPCVSGLWFVLLAGGMPVGGRAPCRSVRRFPAFRPRTPCFCNPLMVSQEQPDYLLSSVLKADASTATSAKSQGIRTFLDSRVLTVHFRSLAGAE